MDKTRVRVKIFGADYVVVSDQNESENYINYLAQKVDQKMGEISESAKHLSIFNLGVLTGLEYCDTAEKSQKKCQDLEKALRKSYEKIELLCVANSKLKEEIRFLSKDFDSAEPSLADTRGFVDDKQMDFEELKEQQLYSSEPSQIHHSLHQSS